jgi:HSP20 family molecular chaperone IbpA
MINDTVHTPHTFRRTISRRLETLIDIGGTISPVERWADDNYAPTEVPVNESETDDGYVVTAELPGFESQHIHVDLVRDRLIILAFRASEGSSSERYHEVRLPSTIHKNSAVVEFDYGLLTVTFTKPQPGLAAWLHAAGQKLQKWLSPFSQGEQNAYPN